MSRPEFFVWVFLHAILARVNAITFLPLWSAFFSFVNRQVKSETLNKKHRIVLPLFLRGIILTILIFAILKFINDISDDYFVHWFYTPKKLNNRIYFIYSFTVLSALPALPALLGIMSIYTAGQKLSLKIGILNKTKEKLFALRDELLQYRFLLQRYLLILGIILSLASITGVGYRAIFVGLKAWQIEYFPVTHAVFYGLIFMVLLLLVYLPVHFMLLETSRKLRDSVCLVISVDTLQDVMTKRKCPDEMLYINVNIISNIKSGFMTLTPFVSSILAGFLGDIGL